MEQKTKEKPSKLNEILTWALVGIGSLALIDITDGGCLAMGNDSTIHYTSKNPIKQTTTQRYNISERKY